jgi:hypothetical protein
MSKLTVFIALCAVCGVAQATIGSGLDDDNFRMLKDDEVANDIGDSGEGSKVLLGGGEKLLALKGRAS